MSAIPLFWDSEIRCGRKLGQGTYCTVTAVQDVLLSDQEEIPRIYNGVDPERVMPLRQRLADRFALARTRKVDRHAAIYGKPTGPPKEIDDPEHEPAPKLAIKRIRTAGLEDETLKTAREDFQLELDILVAITSHPNIVDLCGIGFDETTNQPSCLILSQIRTTLTKRLVKWRNDKGIGLYEALAWDLPGRKNLWVERLVVLSRLAHAVLHMHSHQILNRDIKPDNVGFDAVLDIPKLFDFGLAKRIEEENEDGLFHLTPDTGTLRYMAVECGSRQPYGWTADVYSLSILIHEVLSLKIPFGWIPPTQFREIVWEGGGRLPLEETWPPVILSLLPRMWHHNPLERPSMEEVSNELDTMLRGTDNELFPSTYLVPAKGPFSFFSG